ncbi:hypothetical protein E4U14_001402 [Claviceps sp. LM454 group G7]|nr:hypothetical protein E4U14_001402 [Claviceps sp. LM454 group G7]
MNVGDAHRHLRSSETPSNSSYQVPRTGSTKQNSQEPTGTPLGISRRKQNSSEWAHELRRLPSVIQDDPTGIINSLALEAVGPGGWNGVAQAVLTGCGFYSTEMILRLEGLERLERLERLGERIEASQLTSLSGVATREKEREKMRR